MTIADEIATVAARRSALAANTDLLARWPDRVAPLDAAIVAVQDRIDRNAARLTAIKAEATDAGTRLGKRTVAAGLALGEATARATRAKRAGFTIEAEPGANAAALAAAQAEVEALKVDASDTATRLDAAGRTAEAERDGLAALHAELLAERAELIERLADDERKQANFCRQYG